MNSSEKLSRQFLLKCGGFVPLKRTASPSRTVDIRVSCWGLVYPAGDECFLLRCIYRREFNVSYIFNSVDFFLIFMHNLK